MVASGLKRIEARFFVTDVGREPVREWLFELDRNDRRQIGRDLMTLEFGLAYRDAAITINRGRSS